MKSILVKSELDLKKNKRKEKKNYGYLVIKDHSGTQ